MHCFDKLHKVGYLPLLPKLNLAHLAQGPPQPGRDVAVEIKVIVTCIMNVAIAITMSVFDELG